MNARYELVCLYTSLGFFSVISLLFFAQHFLSFFLDAKPAESLALLRIGLLRYSTTSDFFLWGFSDDRPSVLLRCLIRPVLRPRKVPPTPTPTGTRALFSCNYRDHLKTSLKHLSHYLETC